METIKVVVASSNKTVNDNFCNKLEAKGAMIDTPLGKVEGSSRTFYLFTDKENAEGTEAEINLELFDIVQKEFPFKDENDQEQIAKLNYLYPKR